MEHKVLAFYLPQYHEIQENSEWWGDGYTDWVAVKKAKKLYSWHKQPKEPYNHNYYDLSEIESLKWQETLMKKYGIDGLCIYHYYFENGRKILEKPAEMIRDNREIDIPFCFCWANTSWVSSWENIDRGSVWAKNYSCDNKSRSVYLLKQDYGNEDKWKEHYNYLNIFFKDERYIKIDNKPVFFIHVADDIECLESMKTVWDSQAKNNGFDGIYLIAGSCQKEYLNYVDAYYYHEPSSTFGRCPLAKREGQATIVDYDDVWRELLLKEPRSKTTIFTGFVGYDDTPRHGESGLIVRGQKAEKFRKYLSELIAKNIANNSPFTIINAFNEWGEGMYLEPDEGDAFNYLEAVLQSKELYKDELERYKIKITLGLFRANQNVGYENYKRIMTKWFELKLAGIKLFEYMDSFNWTKICIYGYGKLGHFLIEELEEQVEIKAVIDKNKPREIDNIVFLSPSEKLPKCDVVVIALSFDIDKIKRLLTDNNDGVECISVEELINKVTNYQK